MEENNMRSMIGSTFGDNKLNKSTELNDSMSIKNQSQDEYTRKIKNIGGNQSE